MHNELHARIGEQTPQRGEVAHRERVNEDDPIPGVGLKQSGEWVVRPLPYELGIQGELTGPEPPIADRRQLGVGGHEGGLDEGWARHGGKAYLACGVRQRLQ